MKHFPNIMCAAMFLAVLSALASCQKEPGTTGEMSERIAFGMGSNTKVPITDVTQLQNSSTALVFVYGTRNGSAMSAYSSTQLKYNSTGIWTLNSGNDQTWTSGSNYLFWGWAYSPTNATTTYVSGSTPYLTVSNNGTNISVHQPLTYNSAAMVDYMISYQYPATPVTTSGTTRGPIVELSMEHALAMVEIYVIKATAMTHVYVDDIRIRNFYTGFNSSSIFAHQEYGSGLANVWQFTPTGSMSADYRMQGVFNNVTGTNVSAYEATSDMASTPAKMRFIAIPQLLTQNCELYIHYWAEEGGVYTEHSLTFLPYTKSRWSSGKRTIYRITVDTSIHLQAYIEDWQTVSFIQGTILPRID